MPPQTPPIASLQNPQVKKLVKLRQRRVRDAEGLMLIEEPLVITRALAAGQPLTAAYYCPEQLSAAAEDLLGQLRAVGGKRWQPVPLTSRVMAKAAYRARPEGLLVVARQVHLKLEDIPRSTCPLLVIVTGVEKPGNLGAILRSADAAGANGVLLVEPRTDLFNPNVLRAARGANFGLPVVSATTTAILAFAAERGLALVATSPATGISYTECDFTGPVAVVLGAEDKGLDASWLEHADRQVHIPMRGRGDSLNVATSCALLLYEALRQRGQQ